MSEYNALVNKPNTFCMPYLLIMIDVQQQRCKKGNIKLTKLKFQLPLGSIGSI